MASAPIRIGFIGLSASGGWATIAHFPYLKQSSKYAIVALCNSSIDAAKAAVAHYSLPPSTKTYGSTVELAADPDVDLVVCCVRVDRHYETIRPSLEAGKNVYVEWPLGANLDEAQELTDIANKKGVTTLIGLQARHSPVVNTVRNLVESGRIGNVLSSTVVSSAGNYGPTENAWTRYFTERKIGGNMVSIHFGHTIDYILYTLGELSSFNGMLSIQRPRVDILDRDSNKVETVTKDTHDQIMLQGTLKSGGVLSVHLRGGAPFSGEPGLTWRIYGETGEIMVTANGPFLQIGYPAIDIRLHDFAKGEVQNIDENASGSTGGEDLPLPARNVSRVYEAYASERAATHADFNEALKRHRLLDQLYKSSETSSKVSYV